MDRAPDHSRLALVVDDDAIVRMDTPMILYDAGSKAIEASNGDKALLTVEDVDGRIGLLFTDVDMPIGSIDGFRVARAVAQRWPDVSILVASGRHALGDTGRADRTRPSPRFRSSFPISNNTRSCSS